MSLTSFSLPVTPQAFESLSKFSFIDKLNAPSIFPVESLRVLLLNGCGIKTLFVFWTSLKSLNCITQGLMV